MARHDHHDDGNGNGHGGHHHDHLDLDREWSDEEIERMILTGLVVLVAAALSYLFVVYLPGRRKRAASAAAAAPPTPRQARQRRTREEGGGGGVGAGGGGGGVLPSSTPPVRLVDGVMPFSYLRAHREQLDEHRRKQQRRDGGGAAPAQGSGSVAFAPIDPREARRLLQRLSRLSRRSSSSQQSSSSTSGAASSSSGPSPPSAVSMSAKRGALAVVTVRRRELEGSEESRCAARDVLHLLGSVCNLFVILSPDDDDGGDGGGEGTGTGGGSSDSKSAHEVEKEVERFKDRLYGASRDGDTGTALAPGLLHEAYVPRHRLVACSSPVGRIAFVRQLRPEWTLDYDPTVRDQLGRFGFHVILYGENAFDPDDAADGDGEGTCRTLGDLIPRTSEAAPSASAAGSSSDPNPTGGHEKQE